MFTVFFIFFVLKNGKEENLIPLFFFLNPFHCNRYMLGMIKMQGGNSLMAQWLRFLHSQCRWCGLIPV